MRKNTVLVFAILLVFKLIAAPVPQFSQDKHLGVASCSTGVCHGKSVEDVKENVKMTEYRTWLQFDDHSKAYKTLLKPTSKQMAQKLGLKSAHTAKICLDCHADNIPLEKRGKKFQITDGVGCEACHGGAQRWLPDHKEPGATHEKNIGLGLYPSEKSRDRGKLCLSCHLGTKDKFVTHRIMAAGHPRLSFELESFTQNQPAHYKVDDDYEKRKGSISSVNMWITGLLFKANAQLQLLQSNQFIQHGLFPELSFYECHSCHRAMSPSRWPIESASNNLTTGAVRLDDAALVILTTVLGTIPSFNSEELSVAINQLHAASLIDKQTTVKKAQLLEGLIKSYAQTLINKSYSRNDKIALRMRLLSDSSKGKFRDYSSAEQAFFAIETLSIELNDDSKYKKQLDKMYDSLQFEDKYYPNQFQVLSQLFIKELGE